MRILIFAFFSVCCSAAQELPKDLFRAPHRLNHEKYCMVEFKDTIVLMDNSFWGFLFNPDVRYRVKFSELPVVWVNNVSVSLVDWHGKILTAPGCLATQKAGPKEQLFFEDRSIEGVTIRGKGGMVIEYRCSTFAEKEKTK